VEAVLSAGSVSGSLPETVAVALSVPAVTGLTTTVTGTLVPVRTVPRAQSTRPAPAYAQLPCPGVAETKTTSAALSWRDRLVTWLWAPAGALPTEIV
jgi:hypothetical protein